MYATKTITIFLYHDSSTAYVIVYKDLIEYSLKSQVELEQRENVLICTSI